MSFPLVFEIIRSIYERRYNAFIGYSVKARAAKLQIDPLAVVLASVSYALRYSKTCVKIKIIYACYHGHVKSVDNFLAEFITFKDYMQSQGLVVDHLNDDVHNNSVYNLSLLDEELNTSKGSTVSRFKYPSKLLCAYVAGQYRIKFVQKASSNIETGLSALGIRNIEGCITVTMHIVCNDAQSFVECIKELSNIPTNFMEPARNSRGKWLNQTAPDWTRKVSKAIEEQRRLAELPADVFDTYKQPMKELHISDALACAEG